MSKRKRDELVPWVRCRDCDDFFCQVHHEHVFDCTCPEVDDWVAELECLPYEAIAVSVIEKFLSAHA